MASIRKTKQEPFSVQELDAIWARSSVNAEVAGLTRGACDERHVLMPPLGNTGGKFKEGAGGEGSHGVLEKLLLVDGKPLIIPGRRGYGGDNAFPDWVNFTAKRESFFNENPEAVGENEDRVILEVSFACEKIFGFGISHKRETGMNYYRSSYVLGASYGVVCIGGQRDTVLVSLSGEGCAAAKQGWEKRLHDWLTDHSIQGRLTRVDLAHDDYDGLVSVDDYDFVYDLGNFNNGGRNPGCEHKGDWKNPNGKGRTFCVGSRENGKYFRAYEKGRQLGDKQSPWVRTEVEFKSVDRDIPFDVLLRPGEYLAAAYPACGWINQKQQRIKTTNKAAQISYQAGIDWLKAQCGAWLWSCAVIEGDGDEQAGVAKLFEKISRAGVIPKRLQVPDYRDAPRSVHIDAGMALA